MALTRFVALVPVLAVVVHHAAAAHGALPGTLSHDGEDPSQSIAPSEDRVAGGDYPILHLTLDGPLDLRLLGLNIQLDRLALDITATPDEGLLGAMLGAVLGSLTRVVNDSAFGRLARRDH